MLDLEQSIAQWRQQMVASGINAPALLEELEAHLCGMSALDTTRPVPFANRRDQ